MTIKIDGGLASMEGTTLDLGGSEGFTNLGAAQGGNVIDMSALSRLGSDDDEDQGVVQSSEGAYLGRGLVSVQEIQDTPEDDSGYTPQAAAVSDEEDAAQGASLVPVDIYDAMSPDLPPIKRFVIKTSGPNKKTVEEVTRKVEDAVIDGVKWIVDNVWIRFKNGEALIVVYANRL